MKNKIKDLNDHLFVALERLNDESLSADDAAFEIDRSRAVINVAQSIIDVGDLILKAEHMKQEKLPQNVKMALLGD